MAIDPGGRDAEGGRDGLARSIRSLFAESPASASAAVAGCEGVSGGDDAPAGDLRPEPRAFRNRVRAFLAAPVERRAALLGPIEEEARALRRENVLEPLVDAVVELALGAEPGPGGDAALALASKLATPGVTTTIAIRLGAERDPDRRRALVETAERLPEAMAPALAEALADASDRGARRVCLATLGALGPAGRAEAVKMLDDPRWFVVRNGVALLAGSGVPAAVAQLTGALGHGDARVRREAVLALAHLGGEDAETETLLVGMLADGDTGVRTRTVTALAALRVERAVRPLLELLEESGDEDLQVEVLRALGSPRRSGGGSRDPEEGPREGVLPDAAEGADRGVSCARGHRNAPSHGPPPGGCRGRDPVVRRAFRTLVPEAKGES